MHGPYGIVIRFRRPPNLPEDAVEKATAEAHFAYKALPGFRSVTYFNINEEEYTAAIAFYTERAADNALEPIRKAVLSKIPDAVVSKGEVVPGDFVDELVANGGKVGR